MGMIPIGTIGLTAGPVGSFVGPVGSSYRACEGAIWALGAIRERSRCDRGYWARSVIRTVIIRVTVIAKVVIVTTGRS